MKQLEQEKQNKVDKLVNESYELYQSGNNKKSFELLEEAWSLFDRPNEYPEAYNVAKYAFEDCLKGSNLEGAKLWLNRMIKNNNELHHSDECCSFNLAKFKFDNEEFKEAYELFNYVVEESGYRYFEGENSKYLDFYKKPKEYIK